MSIALAGAMVLTGLSWSTGQAEPPPPEPEDGPSVYSGVLDRAGLDALLASGVDRHEVEVTSSDTGQFEVEAILSATQAEQLAEVGADLAPQDSSAARRTTALAAPVFRPYSGPGNLQAELSAQAAAHPTIAKLEVIGQTVQGKDINAVRVTRNVARITAGRRPTTVYVAAQHAREWITPEMVRRLLDHVLTSYGTDPEITRLVNTNELWFIPVANPDGYDFTFTPGRRLWRKNLRDNNGDGLVTGADGVDLNRNYPTRWGYDNEGSSPNPVSDTYRGTGPASEPETQALDALVRQDHAGVPHQLPLGGRAAVARDRLAGGHAIARRRAVPGHGRRRRQPGGTGLRPRHLGGAVHHQRRHGLAHAGGPRHPRLHP